MRTEAVSPQRHRDTERTTQETLSLVAAVATGLQSRGWPGPETSLLRVSVPLWLKVFVCGIAASMLVACGGGPKVPDWKKDSASLIERYKKAELKGENLRAEHYFQQALDAAGSAGRLGETARLHLVRCATRQASLDLEPCNGYLDHAKYGTSAEDETYYLFLTNQWDRLDSGKLPVQYRAFVKGGEPARTPAVLQGISDPLSRLIALSLVVARKQADDALLNLAADTASEQGWRKPLLVYLKLLEGRAALQDDKKSLEKIRARIRLVEESF